MKIVHLPLKRASLSLHWNPESKTAIVGHLLTLSSTFGLDADGTASPRPVGGFISAWKVWFNKTAYNRLFDYSIGSSFEDYRERNSCGQNVISLIVNNHKKKVFCQHVSTCVLRQKDERLREPILLKSFCNCLSMHTLDIVGYHYLCDTKIGLMRLQRPCENIKKTRFFLILLTYFRFHQHHNVTPLPAAFNDWRHVTCSSIVLSMEIILLEYAVVSCAVAVWRIQTCW